MINTITKYYQYFHNIFKTANAAISPIYRLIVSLIILIIGMIMKSTKTNGADAFLYFGIIATFIMSLKASYYYYKKSKEL